MSTHGHAFNERIGTGLLITLEDLENCGVLETLAMGESKAYALALEQHLIDLLH